jgi:hypothetical protein
VANKNSVVREVVGQSIDRPAYAYIHTAWSPAQGWRLCNDNGRGLMFGVEVNCQNNSNIRKAVLVDVLSTVLRFYLAQIAVTAS